MTEYRVIGADGREYGPVNRELLQTWIREGRVHAGTLVCAVGLTAWRTLGSLPEFQSFMAPAPIPSGGTGYYTTVRRTNPWAIWGFVFGLLSLTLCSCCCLPLELFGIVFSVIALIQIGNNPQTQSGNVLAILGLVLSLMSLLMGIAMSFVWFSSEAGGEFMNEMHRGMQAGLNQLL